MPQMRQCCLLVLLYLAIVLLFVASDSSAWSYHTGVELLPDDSMANVTAQFGLFVVCKENLDTGGRNCANHTDIYGWLIAVRFFVILGFLLGFLVTVSMTVYQFVRNRAYSFVKLMPIISGIVGLLGALAVVVGCCIWGGNAFNFDISVYPYYAFYLAMIGALFLAVGSILSLTSKTVDADSVQ